MSEPNGYRSPKTWADFIVRVGFPSVVALIVLGFVIYMAVMTAADSRADRERDNKFRDEMWSGVESVMRDIGKAIEESNQLKGEYLKAIERQNELTAQQNLIFARMADNDQQ